MGLLVAIEGQCRVGVALCGVAGGNHGACRGGVTVWTVDGSEGAV